MSEKRIYRLNDNISFRICTLGRKSEITQMVAPYTTMGDCTNYCECEENWKRVYYCNQQGIHFHCTTHPEIELNEEKGEYGRKVIFRCPRCDKPIEVEDRNEITRQCLRMLNIEKFKDAKLIRLDDWYVPEIKKKLKTDTDYFMSTQVKKDKDGDTIIVLYVGHKGTEGKAQLFIKPEKLQLSSDYKDMDPAKVIAKIEVTLKDRTLLQKFDDDE